jgi:hypothetical protein
MSLGGLAVETPFPMERGSVHELQLTLGDGAAVDLRARVMHCRNVAPEGAEPLFLSGLQFIDDDREDPSPVGDIMGRFG